MHIQLWCSDTIECDKNIQIITNLFFVSTIADVHNMMINDWKDGIDTYIVCSVAILNLYSTVQTKESVLIVGPRGCGKSSALRWVAFESMENGNYEVVPCTKPGDMLNYHNPYRNQLFIFDDVCETTSKTVFFTGEWNKLATMFKSMMNTADKSTKHRVLFSFDVIAFNTVKRQNQASSIITESHIFDMLADENHSTENDITDITRKYEVTDCNVTELSALFCFFPELCSRHRSFKNKGENIDIMPVAFQIIDEHLKELTDDDIILLATLSLFVIYDNKITNEMLKKDIQKKLHDMALVINASKSSLSISAVEQKLASLTGFYITKGSGCFTVINDDMFQGIVSFFYHYYFYLILEVSPLESFTFKSEFWLDFINGIGRKMLIDDHTAKIYYTELLNKVEQSDHVKTKNRNADGDHTKEDFVDG